ncbi:MAG: transcription antitermination factor NusB [Candidatus Jidaibacter sp.]|jgi:N utilization substance protein B|nr:transcription antitermination factor NusB [Candidatus Jidaibacter sp.]
MEEVKNTTSFLSKKILKKRAARVLAVQCIYAVIIDTISGSSVDDKILGIIELYSNELEDSRLSRADQTFLINLVRKTFEYKDTLQGNISQYLAKEWRFERLANVVQSILLAAACELFLDRDTDKEVIINEYLEIAKIFSHAGEVGFLNQVLDQIAKAR